MVWWLCAWGICLCRRCSRTVVAWRYGDHYFCAWSRRSCDFSWIFQWCFLCSALAGLGAPHWKPDARGLLSGITGGTTKAHVARRFKGTLQNVDILSDDSDAGCPLQVLKVDGGMLKYSLCSFNQMSWAIVRPIFETTAEVQDFLVVWVLDGLTTAVQDAWRSLHFFTQNEPDQDSHLLLCAFQRHREDMSVLPLLIYYKRTLPCLCSLCPCSFFSWNIIASALFEPRYVQLRRCTKRKLLRSHASWRLHRYKSQVSSCCRNWKADHGTAQPDNRFPVGEYGLKTRKQYPVSCSRGTLLSKRPVLISAPTAAYGLLRNPGLADTWKTLLMSLYHSEHSWTRWPIWYPKLKKSNLLSLNEPQQGEFLSEVADVLLHRFSGWVWSYTSEALGTTKTKIRTEFALLLFERSHKPPAYRLFLGDAWWEILCMALCLWIKCIEDAA